MERVKNIGNAVPAANPSIPSFKFTELVVAAMIKIARPMNIRGGKVKI